MQTLLSFQRVCTFFVFRKLSVFKIRKNKNKTIKINNKKLTTIIADATMVRAIQIIGHKGEGMVKGLISEQAAGYAADKFRESLPFFGGRKEEIASFNGGL